MEEMVKGVKTIIFKSAGVQPAGRFLSLEIIIRRRRHPKPNLVTAYRTHILDHAIEGDPFREPPNKLRKLCFIFYLHEVWSARD